MREFKPDERAHAVAEERETFVEVWSQGLAGEPHELVHVRASRLRDARASTGQLYGTDFDRSREIVLP
jgi:hypothetical protein